MSAKVAGELGAAAAGGVAASAAALLAFTTAAPGPDYEGSLYQAQRRTINATVASYAAAAGTVAVLGLASRSARDGAAGALAAGLFREARRLFR